MWVSWKDGGITFYKGRDAFVRWYREFQARSQSLADQSAKAVVEYALPRGIDYLFVDKQNYGWLCTTGLEAVFENDGYLVARVLRRKGSRQTSDATLLKVAMRARLNGWPT